LTEKSDNERLCPIPKKITDCPMEEMYLLFLFRKVSKGIKILNLLFAINIPKLSGGKMLKIACIKNAMRPLFLVLACTVLTTGCGANIAANIDMIPKDHILMFNYKGNPVDPCTFAATRPKNQNGPSPKDKPNEC